MSNELKELNEILKPLFGNRFDQAIRKRTCQSFGILPEDANILYIWSNMCDKTRSYFKKQWKEYRKTLSKSERQTRLNNEMFDWYEEAYASRTDDQWEGSGRAW